MLLRTISTESRHKIYHKDGCPYIAKISPKFKKTVDLDQYGYRKWKACKYCGGLRGWARIFHKRPDRKDREKHINCWYDDKSKCIFLKTKVGFWKVYWKCSDQKYLLFHRNGQNEEKSNRELMNGGFHRQKDVSPTPDFDSLVNYIASHDKNKEIASKDYRKLPQKTKKQKKIFRHYAKKAKKVYHEHMNELFESIKTRK